MPKTPKQILDDITSLKKGAIVTRDVGIATAISNKASETGKLNRTPYGKKPNPNAKSGGAYIPKGFGNGGPREGAGRPPKEELMVKRGLKQWKDDFFNGDFTMTVRDPKTGQERQITKPRHVWLYERLFEKAVTEVDIAKIKELLDRNEGKAAQPIRGEGEDDAPIKLEMNIVDSIIKKAYGDDTTTE